MQKKYIVALVFVLFVTLAAWVFFVPKKSRSLHLASLKKLAPIEKRVRNEPQSTTSPERTTGSVSPQPHITVNVGDIIPQDIEKKAAQNTSVKTYQHPQLKYALQYPSQWKAETVEAPYEGYESYLDARVYPIGAQTRVSQYQSTPEVIVRAEDTDKTLQEYFEADPLGKQYAEKVQNTTIASVPAIIYDWSFDPMVHQTTALFILKSVAYKIQLSWVSEEQKNSALDEFVLIYQSFSK